MNHYPISDDDYYNVVIVSKVYFLGKSFLTAQVVFKAEVFPRTVYMHTAWQSVVLVCGGGDDVGVVNWLPSLLNNSLMRRYGDPYYKLGRMA